MRLNNFQAFLRALLQSLLLLPALWLAQPAWSGPWVDASLFNADVAQLKQVFPQMQKLAKPRWGPGGSRGLWVLPTATIAGYSFEPVLYLRDGRLQRLEQSWVSDAYPCLARAVFDDVVQSINAWLGNLPTASADNDADAVVAARGKTAIWNAEDTDLIAYIQETNMQCSVRLVNRPRQLKNADTL